MVSMSINGVTPRYIGKAWIRMISHVPAPLPKNLRLALSDVIAMLLRVWSKYVSSLV
jgi:hypothetical protein